MKEHKCKHCAQPVHKAKREELNDKRLAGRWIHNNGIFACDETWTKYQTEADVSE